MDPRRGGRGEHGGANVVADYRPAIVKLLDEQHEGGWTAKPAETFRGIDRAQNPDWPGWARVDGFRVGAKVKRFPANALADSELDAAALLFYKPRYWDAVGGDDVPSQALAERLFDFGVTSGPRDAVKALQRALNFLNATRFPGDRWHEVAIDGVWGRETRSALRRCFALHASGIAPRDLAKMPDEAVQRLVATLEGSVGYEEAEEDLCLAMRALQAAHYVAAAEGSPSLRAFARGWLRRAMKG